MSYEKQTWYDDPSGGTPLTADKMNHIEDGIEELDQFCTSIAPTFYQTEKQTAMMSGTSNRMFNFALDLPDGYTACALQYLSISSSNAACVAGSYRIVEDQLNVNVRNTSGAQISADVEASVLCLKLQ